MSDINHAPTLNVRFSSTNYYLLSLSGPVLRPRQGINTGHNDMKKEFGEQTSLHHVSDELAGCLSHQSLLSQLSRLEIHGRAGGIGDT